MSQGHQGFPQRSGTPRGSARGPHHQKVLTEEEQTARQRYAGVQVRQVELPEIYEKQKQTSVSPAHCPAGQGPPRTDAQREAELPREPGAPRSCRTAPARPREQSGEQPLCRPVWGPEKPAWDVRTRRPLTATADAEQLRARSTCMAHTGLHGFLRRVGRLLSLCASGG